jgi:trehalose-6-phosphate synthase
VARELRDALFVNPYDIDQTAEAIRFALEMDPDEKRQRIQRMRKIVKEHNVYRWAANLVGQLCDIRIDAPATSPGPSTLKLPVGYQPRSLDEGGMIA